MKQTNLATHTRVFWVSFAISIICFVGGYAISPEQVAIHFSVDGSVNNTSNSLTLLSIWLCVLIFAIIPLYLLAISMKKLPEESINLPNKDYWFKTKNKDEAFKRIEAAILDLASANTLFLAAIAALVAVANQSTPPVLNMTLVTMIVLVFFMYLGFWFVKLFTAFKLPA